MIGRRSAAAMVGKRSSDRIVVQASERVPTPTRFVANFVIWGAVLVSHFDAMGTRTLYNTHSQRIHPKTLPHGPCQLIRPPILPSNHFIMLVNNHPSLVQC